MVFLGLLELFLFFIFIWVTYRLFFWAFSPLLRSKEDTEKGRNDVQIEQDEEQEEVDVEQETLERDLRWWRFRRWFPRDE